MPFKFDLFIYLRPSIEECMRRVKSRARDGEEGVSKEYQQKLMDKHDEFFSQDGIIIDNIKVPVKILETDDDFENDLEIQKKILDIFVSYLENL
jgi:deoxyadenosine/deoxycytidine kinase